MPAKNVVKLYSSHAYYHIYNRGVAKQRIFLDEPDKQYFLGLIDRHLNPDSIAKDSSGRQYPKYHEQLELLCYCLMGNHFHFMFYLREDTTTITRFVHSISTAYTMYFNLKYDRVGPLFQGTFKASHVTNDAYLLHISRYIHLNPREYLTYRHSSLAAHLGNHSLPWLRPERVQAMFNNDPVAYLRFLDDYKDRKQLFEDIKNELANA